MGASKRDNFTRKTIEIIARRAGFRCCCPDCRCVTTWAAYRPEKTINVGEAAHICAASPGGPRYDSSMTVEERTSASNGIWLCGRHAKMIDDDPETYTVELLKRWKDDGEEYARKEANNGSQISDGSCIVKTANQQYANMFTEPLFLHREEKNTKVKLENLFVLQEFGVYVRQSEYSDRAMQDLSELFSEFISRIDKEVLFIEGDAGSGKTTLMAWLNYVYTKGGEPKKKLFQGRPLITIRLRDLEKKEISEKHRLVSAVLKYMNVPTLDDLERLFPRAIMILDGFDELCMLEGNGRDNNNLLEDMFRKSLKDYKFIVTSRPKYLNEDRIRTGDFVFIHHFGMEKRGEWLEHYTSDKYCGAQIDEKIYDYIASIDDFSSSCILDTPMTLYMLAAKKGAERFLDNNWALYHHIFYEELSETEYNKMIPDPERNYAHEVQVLKDVLYQISEELAYNMYKEGNQRFYLTEESLSGIIENLSKENPILRQLGMREIAQHCYALCCYWKANTEQGAVEFLHNNIRDFFLAEKILRELDKLVSKGSKVVLADVIEKFAKLFKYGALETKVTEFIYLRALYNKENQKSDFGSYEYKHKNMPAIIRGVAGVDIMTNEILNKELELPPIEIVTNIVTATAQTFRYLYEPYLSDRERIPWHEVLREKNSFLTLFKHIFSQVPVTLTEETMISMGSRGNYCDIVFAGKDLRNIDFQKSDLSGADFSDAILCGSNFKNAVLRGTKFNNADVHYASLKDADLQDCDMTGCDLRGTDLPDGFVSMNQEEQVEHLRSLKIKGLLLQDRSIMETLQYYRRQANICCGEGAYQKIDEIISVLEEMVPSVKTKKSIIAKPYDSAFDKEYTDQLRSLGKIIEMTIVELGGAECGA